jgi:predicted Zn-dependent protease
MNYSFEDIARYAENEMTAEERQLFEAALAADETLQQQLALYNEVQAGLQQQFTRDDKKEALKATLENLGSEYFQQRKAKVISLRTYIRSAVAVAAAIIAVLIWQPWQTSLFDEYAATRMISTTVRGENADTLLEKAAIAFNKEDFAGAAGLLQQVVQLQPGNSLAGYYYGIALLQTARPEEARKILTGVYNGHSVFTYDAAFYIALSYLKEKNRPACREWLEKIPPGANNYDKANELMRKL